MTVVLDYNGAPIQLNDCTCGAQPEYHSANGLAHEIVCGCGRQTDMQICGYDAIDEWNAGRTYASAHDAPIRSKHLIS